MSAMSSSGLVAAARLGRSGRRLHPVRATGSTLREVIRLEREALGQKQPAGHLLRPDLAGSRRRLASARVFSRMVGIKPIFTPYSVSVLESNCNLSHAKASRRTRFSNRGR
jgi:hypothetical protein